MDPLFEAKALFEEQYALYQVYRIDTEKYRAELVSNRDEDKVINAPSQLILEKKEGEWQTEDKNFKELAGTIGTEIDVFNYGYGDILGRIGIQ